MQLFQTVLRLSIKIASISGSFLKICLQWLSIIIIFFFFITIEPLQVQAALLRVQFNSHYNFE